MRPTVLFPLFAPLDSLPRIGPKLVPLYTRLVGQAVVDLLWHSPSGLVDRRYNPTIAEAESGRIATLRVKVDAYHRPETSRQPWRVRCLDETGILHLVFFHSKEDWLKQRLPIGEWRIVSGLLERHNDAAQMIHPDHCVPENQKDSVMTVEPVYPLTAGLTNKGLRHAVDMALERLPDLPEWQDVGRRDSLAWPSWKKAVQDLHHPQDNADLLPSSPARSRLAYDEFLANQLALEMMRRHMRTQKGRSLATKHHLRQQVLDALPFTLTAAQQRSLSEIDQDMAQPLRMVRLLQGDVGSGKTVVALLAMLTAVDHGAQAALMVPTEILARQHFESLTTLTAHINIRIALLTGRDKGKTRAALLEQLANGDIDILIGTHALFQEDVVFRDLALAVVDEQHRFGVHQRLGLGDKGQAVDLLVMTATPIPRTLLLTSYGDMDVSRLDEKPAGRQPITTSVLPMARLDDVVDGARRAIAAGARIYWVCPLVEESEVLDLAAATERHHHLSELFGPRVGLIHGKMKGPDKDQVMEAFAAGNLDILVATTVIEVGVNVPEATVMIIEHAERFGLAQLHQLRGRVGRGSAASSCLLLYAAPLSETAKARLKTMRETEDGFLIAEQDLKLRGGGEVLGTRQSGLPEMKLVDWSEHAPLLSVARTEAQTILDADPELIGPRGEALRTLLYLFERDAAVRTLRSG